MTSVKKVPFSEAVNWRGILITEVANPGNLIHTAVKEEASRDEVWLWASNSAGGGAVVVLTVQFGGTTSPDDFVVVEVPDNNTVPILQGRVLDAGLEVRVFDDTGNTVNVWGYVNRVTG